ncbi:MAG TPA: hypothetical protein VJQ82_17880 [Terriglobales bacterium]|nr:hypothetical protein [Terriglobales bacterium]
MENQKSEEIFSYTDAEALEDGFLVAIGHEPVNRVTRAVFEHFTAPMDDLPDVSGITDVTRLMQAIRSMLKIEPDGDGWRTGSYEGKELWVIPNEVGGATLMFPDDY